MTLALLDSRLTAYQLAPHHLPSPTRKEKSIKINTAELEEEEEGGGPCHLL